MTFSGDLSGIGLADVFQNLAGNRASGTLHVRWDKGERFLRFADGTIAGWSPGPGRELPLFDHVVERGHADAAAVAKLQSTMRRRRKRPARLLVDERLCDAESLQNAFREIVAEGVYELLTLSTATFVFNPGAAPPDVFDADLLAADVRLEIGPVLLEGARRADDYRRIRSVVGSDQDLFVADAQAAERAPDELTAAVAAQLNGTTDVAGVARLVQRSRFEVSSALMQLVQQGLARPATGEEIAALAEQALTAENREEAIRLLGQALVRLPREALLRRRLAETLAAAGRKREAAGEMAVLAFQSTEEEHYDEALAYYDRAIALDAADVLLHQRRCEVLKRLGDKNALRQGLLHWAQRLENLGLADRACEILANNVDAGPLRNDQQLLLRVAELSKANGNLAGAAARYVQIVDLYGGSDLNLEVRCLRAALAAQPEDPAIKKRLIDLESGRAARRRRRRRLLLTVGSTATLALLIVVAAAEELAASRRLCAILRDRPADVIGMATMPALRELAREHTWLPSCQLAAVIEAEEAMRMLRAAGELRLQGRVDDALTTLAVARDSLPELQAQRADALAAMLRAETPLFGWFARLERHGRDDSEAFQALANATDPLFLDFHKDLLPRAASDATRLGILQALQKIDDPRCAESVARALLVTRDPNVGRLCEGLLEKAARRDPQRTQEALAGILQVAREHPEQRDRADRILSLLTANAAAPPPRGH